MPDISLAATLGAAVRREPAAEVISVMGVFDRMSDTSVAGTPLTAVNIEPTIGVTCETSREVGKIPERSVAAILGATDTIEPAADVI